MKNLFFLFAILLATVSFTSAQTYSYRGGTSAPVGNCFCMTSVDPGNTSSAVWEDDGLTLALFQRSNRDLSWDFEIYLGDNDAGGHGIAFVIQGEGSTASGNGGAPLGYGGTSGIIPSIAIEIDTNPNSFDPTTDDHLSVHLQGNHKTPMAGTTPVALPNMEDGAYHSFSVVWHYDEVTPANSTLTATLDGTYTIVANIDPATIFNAFNPIFVGFTAGVNSLARNEQKVSFGAAGSPGSCSVSLPVEFLSFEATALENQQVELNWATASEVNNDYFEVLRSVDGQIWESITHIDGAGTTDEVTHYQTRDEVPFQGRVFYQLKQVDFNGDFSFSDVLEIEVGYQQALSLTAFPNPTSDNLNVIIHTEEIQIPLKVQLFHITGALVLNEYLPPSVSHSQQLSLNVGGLATGMYVVKVNDGQISKTQQIVVAN